MINESLINGTGAWTVVCDSWYGENESQGGRYSVFANHGIGIYIVNPLLRKLVSLSAYEYLSVIQRKNLKFR